MNDIILGNRIRIIRPLLPRLIQCRTEDTGTRTSTNNTGMGITRGHGDYPGRIKSTGYECLRLNNVIIF